MTIKATGYLTDDDGSRQLAYDRTFRAPIADVWAAITESPRLERWIGTWTGTPGARNTIAFTMNAEENPAPEDARIVECVPPTRLVVELGTPGELGQIALTLTEADGVTTLHFAQTIVPDDFVPNYGPGWEYYLDRLTASWHGEPFEEWESYPPVIQAHYDELASQL